MKKHVFVQGKDQCVHCHGTSSTPIECVDRQPSQKDIAEFSARIPRLSGVCGTARIVRIHEPECECQTCLYNRRTN